MEKQERKRASLRSDGKTGKEVSTDELNASMPIRSVHAAEYGCPQLTPCGRHRLERVVGIDWNAWSPSVGTRGRFQWNTHDFCLQPRTEQMRAAVPLVRVVTTHRVTSDRVANLGAQPFCARDRGRLTELGCR